MWPDYCKTGTNHLSPDFAFRDWSVESGWPSLCRSRSIPMRCKSFVRPYPPTVCLDRHIGPS